MYVTPASVGTRLRRRTLAAVAVTGLLATGLVPAAAVSAMPAGSIGMAGTTGSGTTKAGTHTFAAGSYIVLMRGTPVAGYQGGVSGYARSAPAEGRQYDSRSSAAREYRSLLKARQAALRDRAGVTDVGYSYTETLNGFSARLSARQAQELARDRAVLAVVPDEERHLLTTDSPTFLGLTGPDGVWAGLGGDAKAGKGTVVGIIDTGVWPESKSFSGATAKPVPGWNGVCQSGEDFPASTCNSKLIGARFYTKGVGVQNIQEHDYVSPRDYGGHGSHTASTAVGNIVDVQTRGETRTASGMAPAAKLAVYKVCWQTGRGGGCFSSDSAAAIDDATADGVDVLNFSISGTRTNFLDPVELGFMYAADAGVFVAASSGNSGPTSSTTAHPSPWLTTVAASTHTVNESTVVLGDGTKYIGASITGGLPATPAVLSDTAVAEGATTSAAALCYPGSLDPAVVTGKVVVCDRGVIARLDKSYAVQQAGGVGMVLVNTSAGSLNADNHFVPSVHLSHEFRTAIRTYVSTASNPTVEILAGVHEGSPTRVPEVAAFSSRGPSLSAGGDLFKPDVSAPGVDVLAAVAPPGNYGRNYDYYSGTSMSSPHIAGLAALFAQRYPGWSPMAVKSAMMTTARDHVTTTDPFAQGAGFVTPKRFFDPGLVFKSDQDDWWDFLAGQGVRYSNGTPVSDNPIDASDLNLASIAIGSLVGQQTVTRTITNVGSTSSTYRAAVSGMPGVAVNVTPAQVRLAPEQSAKVSITFTRTDAAFGAYSKGSLTWADKTHQVRIPLAVRPVPLAAPAEVSGTGTSGSTTARVTAGFSGTLDAKVTGLVGVVPEAGTAPNTQGANFSPTLPGVKAHEVIVPAGTTLARFDLDSVDDSNDFDLFVYKDGKSVASSATGSGDERVTLSSPAAGTYTAYVQLWGGADVGAYELSNFVVDATDAGNASVTPASAAVTVGETREFTAAWNGLDPSQRYLGWIGWYNGASLVGRTILSVD